MKTKKRALSLLLALFLMVGLVSSATAAAPAKEDINLKKIDVATGETVVLKASDMIDIIVELSSPALLDIDPDHAQDYFAKPASLLRNDINALGSRSQYYALSLADKALRAQQGLVIKKVLALSGSKDVLATYSAVMNGFAVRVPAGKVDAIKALDGVVEVYDSLTYDLPETVINEPNDTVGNDKIGATITWNATGYTGKGQIIAICDSGLDYNHPLFSAMEENAYMISLEALQTILDRRDLNCVSTQARYNTMNAGQFYRSNKVPFGYDYGVSNWDNDPMDNTSDPGHGTHVTGIAAANRTEDNAAIGVAPDAQIFALKVFPNSTDVNILAAVDDAVKLGVTSINLSLGTTAGFTDTDGSNVFNTYGRAKDAGVSVSISSGNSYRSGERDAANYAANIVGRPYTSNLDYGMVGSPSTTRSVTTVASADNYAVYSPSFTIDNVDKKFMYIDTNPVGRVFAEVFGGRVLELAFIGLAGTEDVAGLDLTGKIAVARRGTHTFVDKANNAASRGAVGLLVVDNAPSGVISMVTEGALIPLVSMTKADGEIVISSVLAGNTTVRINASTEFINSSAAGYMSPFSSWGVTPDLKLKPEITGFGGNIYSTYPLAQGGYVLMSGTSMSAPQVTGASAIVQQRVKADYPSYTGVARKELVDSLMQSTATPMLMPNGFYASPRQAGAGMVNLIGATTSDVIVQNIVAGDGRAKVELGDKLETEFSFVVRAKSLGSVERSFDLSALVLTDGYSKPDGFFYTCEDYDIPLDADVTFNVDGQAVTSVTVGADSFVDITVNVKLDENKIAELLDEVFINGMFVDGYVLLTAKGEYPNVNLPYVGYIGDWTTLPVYDNNIYDEAGTSLYNRDRFTTPIRFSGNQNTTVYAGTNTMAARNEISGIYDYRLVSMSPGVTTNFTDTLTYVATQVRNRTALNVSVVNSAGEVVREVTNNSSSVRKTSYNGDTSTTATVNLISAFNGRVGSGGTTALLPDGQYKFVIKSAVDYPGSSVASNPIVKELPFTIDTVAPTALSAWILDVDGKKILTVNTQDGHYVMAANLRTSEAVVDTAYFQLSAVEKDPSASFDVTSLLAGYESVDAFLANISVELYDMAWNSSSTSLASIFKTKPDAIVTTFTAGPSIVETLSAHVVIDIQGEYLGEMMISSGAFGADTYPVTAGRNVVYIPEAGEAGIHEIYLFSDDEVVAITTIEVLAYSTDIWTVTPFTGEDGYLRLSFNADLTAPKGAAKLNGAAVQMTVESARVVRLGVLTEALPAQSVVVISGIKYPALFPSYSFTFTVRP